MFEPFATRKINDSHQHFQQAVEMARVIGSFGYNVDVAAYNNPEAAKRVKGKYDLIIGLIPRGVDYWTGHMNKDCKRIAYTLEMNLAVTRAREQERLQELYKRRGCKLESHMQKLGFITNDIEKFDAVIHICNSHNFHSYDCFKMPPAYRVFNNGYNFAWLNQNIIRDKHNFIFFASWAQVHKGLGLLLEIFSKPGFKYNLYICSKFFLEEDFCEEYYHELFESPNIFPVGFIDINGSKFRELTEKCAYALLPSCAEANCGSVLTMMSAGVIPIVSKECGYDDDEEVINLPDCKLETIEKFICEYALKSDDWIREKSSRCVEIVRTRYSQKNFTDSVKDAMTAILKQSE